MQDRDDSLELPGSELHEFVKQIADVILAEMDRAVSFEIIPDGEDFKLVLQYIGLDSRVREIHGIAHYEYPNKMAIDLGKPKADPD